MKSYKLTLAIILPLFSSCAVQNLNTQETSSLKSEIQFDKLELQKKENKLQSQETLHILYRRMSSNEKTKNIEIIEQEIWREGDKKLRKKEKTNGLELLTIYNSPDIYLINLTTANTVHTIDTDKPAVAVLPMFDDESIKMELGREWSFMQENKASKENTVVNLIEYDNYNLEISGARIQMITNLNKENPLYVLYQKGDIKIIYSYQTYEKIEQNNKLFEIPKNIQIIENY